MGTQNQDKLKLTELRLRSMRRHWYLSFIERGRVIRELKAQIKELKSKCRKRALDDTVIKVIKDVNNRLKVLDNKVTGIESSLNKREIKNDKNSSNWF